MIFLALLLVHVPMLLLLCVCLNKIDWNICIISGFWNTLRILSTDKQGFSWTEIYFGHFVQAAPILFGHLEFFLGHFFNTKFYHHKRKLPSALLKLKPGVVSLPFRMVSAV